MYQPIMQILTTVCVMWEIIVTCVFTLNEANPDLILVSYKIITLITDLLRWKVYTEISTGKDNTISLLQDLIKMSQTLNEKEKI